MLRRLWQGYRRWRLARLLRARRIPAQLWCQVVGELPLLQAYARGDRHRLRVLASRFLQDKLITGVADFEPSTYMRVVIAAQACVPILNLGLDYYQGWREIILYPDSFVVQAHWQDEFGVVHEGEEGRSGEAWQQGPILLAWDAIAPDRVAARPAYMNLVIHEFAHKLDLLNGVADGYPPLHRAMNSHDWSEVFANLFNQLSNELNAGHDIQLDPYACTNPAEFFAVLSEYFFMAPGLLASRYPTLYWQLAHFYQQTPAG
ncbi:MAG: zinc-dependent peptidase [Thiohalomonadaceae bacterium]